VLALVHTVLVDAWLLDAMVMRTVLHYYTTANAPSVSYVTSTRKHPALTVVKHLCVTGRTLLVLMHGL
jgi:hypothetical protein